MLTIDGAMGEGGGQILRTSLALSLCRSTPFRIVNIRSNRRRPGLMPQHLAAVRAAAEVGGAAVEGAELGAQELRFMPASVRSDRYRFDIGTAGSTTLVLETVLPALITAGGQSSLELIGGTHNPSAPPFEFLQLTLVPLLRRMGADVKLELVRPGFYPAGGGILRAQIEGCSRLRPLTLNARGEIVDKRAVAMVAHLPLHIAQRELRVASLGLDLEQDKLQILNISSSISPGNVLAVVVESEQVTEVFTGIGVRGLPAETVAAGVVQQARRYLDAEVPVGAYLADQLLLPMALAGSGSYLSLPPTLHTATNIAVIKQFMPVEIDCEAIAQDRSRVWVGCSVRGGESG